MLRLPKPKIELEKLEDASKAVNVFIGKNGRIPKSLKKEFGIAWGKPYEVGETYIKLTTSKEGGSNSIYVEDAVLLKSALAVPLYDLYKKYIEQFQRIDGLIRIDEKEKIGEKKSLAPDLKQKIKTAVEQLSDLDSDSISNLIEFLTADKAARIEQFGNYKGLSRTDPFQPAAAKILGLRVDYFGFINDVIQTFCEHRQTQSKFNDLLLHGTLMVGNIVVSTFEDKFTEALEDCRFYNQGN